MKFASIIKRTVWHKFPEKKPVERKRYLVLARKEETGKVYFSMDRWTGSEWDSLFVEAWCETEATEIFESFKSLA